MRANHQMQPTRRVTRAGARLIWGRYADTTQSQLDIPKMTCAH